MSRRLLAPIVALIATMADVVSASDPFLIADLVTRGIGSRPLGFVPLGDLVYFTASDARFGRELWVSDGTTTGTRRLTDLHPSGDGLGAELAAFDGRLFFPATDGDLSPRVLWLSDGTTAGTRAVDGERILGPRWLTVAGDRLFFSASDGTAERVWVTDGTAAGSRALQAPGGGPIAPLLMQASGGRLFFTARPAPREAYTLWLSDGTDPGTRAIPSAGDPSRIAPLPDGRLFAATPSRSGLSAWEVLAVDATDPADIQPVQLAEIHGDDALIRPLATVEERLFFSVADGSAGIELWITDGTPAGTRSVTPLETTGEVEIPSISGIGLGSRLIFAHETSALGTELWISDGTAAGTQALADLAPGATSSNPRSFLGLGEEVFFTARTDEAGRELWRTDGTAAGTQSVGDLAPGAASSDPSGLRSIAGEIWMAVSDGETGPEPWISDGSAGGTRPVARINLEGTASSHPAPLATLGRRLLFYLGADPEPVLWSSDGSEAGTRPVAGPTGPVRIVPAKGALSHGGRLYFVGVDAAFGQELWVSDGETGEPLTDLNPGPGDADPGRPAPFGDGVLFTANDPLGLGLWSHRRGSLRKLAALPPATLGSPEIRTTAGQAFILLPRAEGSELWRTDGTPVGTRRVAGVGELPFGVPAVASAGRLFFVAETPSTGLELWSSDGSAAGTSVLEDLQPGPGSSAPHSLTVVGEHVYFLASSGRAFDDQSNIWRTDASGATLERLTDVCVEQMAAAGPTLFFIPCSNRKTVFTLEGEPPRIRRGGDIDPAFRFSFPLTRLGPLTADGGAVYVAVRDVDHPNSLAQVWVSDGSEEGTRVFTDVPGDRIVEPIDWVVPAGGLLFFAANDGIHGRELWAAPRECFPSHRTLCLLERFQVQAHWLDFVGMADRAEVVPVSRQSGGFWFFDVENPELFVKLVDGRDVNGRYWLFLGSLSNLAFNVAVLDTATGSTLTHRNLIGRFASFGTIEGFTDEALETRVLETPASETVDISDGVGSPAPCMNGPEVLCQGGRFRIEVVWRSPQGRIGAGAVRPLSDSLSGFWFFDPENVELVVKVLDGRAVNNRFWVFFGSLTNVAFDLTVTDTATGLNRTYTNPEGRFASFGDTAAF